MSRIAKLYKGARPHTLVISVVFVIFFTVTTARAATIIGSNISTGGTLNVTGLTSLGTASTTELTTTENTWLATTGGRVGIGTSTPGTVLSVGNTGGLNFSLGTSTLNGINLTKGCFAIKGACVGGSGGGGTVTGVSMTTPTGLTVSGSPITTSGTLVLSLASGYNIPLTASTTNWNNFYNTPSGRVTAGTDLAWSGNTLNFTGTQNAGAISTSSPLVSGQSVYATGVKTIASAANLLWNNATSLLTVTGNATTTELTTTGNTWLATLGGRVGIGTTPLSKLDVNGGVAVGSYAGVNAAPSNGMIVSGNVGIGTTTPGSLLSVGNTGGLNFSLGTSTLNGINLTKGCFAIKGACVGGSGGGGTVTSVAASGGTTGLTFSGSPITTSGTLTLSGLLNIAGGGTATSTGGVANGIEYYNGSNLTNNANLIDNGGSQLVTKNSIVVDGITIGLGNNNIASNLGIGGSALASNGTGFQNTAVGSSALESNTTGSYQSSFGYGNLQANTSGTENSGVGPYDLYKNTTGSYNAGFGVNSLTNNITGSGNTAIGFEASNANKSATSTVAIGDGAAQGHAPYSSQGGVSIGVDSSYDSGTNSNYNIAIGDSNSYDLTAGSNNISLGSYVDLPSNTASQQLNIGNLIYGTGVYNGTSMSSTPTGGNVGIGTTSPFATLSVAGSSGVVAEAVSVVISAVKYLAYEIDQYGHVIFSGPTPTVSACGTGATIVGNDNVFRVHVGNTSLQSTCTITFANAYTNPAICQVTPETGSLAFDITASSTKSSTVIGGGTIASDWIVGYCRGYQ